MLVEWGVKESVKNSGGEASWETCSVKVRRSVYIVKLKLREICL